MHEEIAKEIRRAVDNSRNWGETGWPMTFGRQQKPVNSLKEANALEKTFVYRLEAISYWNRVKDAGVEAATWGERALSSLQKGDLKDTDDSIYFAVFLERPVRGEAPVWGPVYEKFRTQVGAGKR